MYQQSAVKNLLKKSELLSPGPPALHRLHTTRSNLDKECKIRKWTFGQKHGNLQNNTILMVGETGTGKTTLINTMVNYFLGVKFEDKVWFEITEEEKRDQTESQTSVVTVYEIVSEERLSSLTIIDTPGYGDTRGIEKDMDIARNLHDLFLHDAGVKDLDAVCLVLKASQNRISDRQRYIFEGVLSLFGKDIEDIIVLCITHSDGGPPTNALEAVKKEKIPCCYDNEDEPVHFLFNNRQSEEQTQKLEKLSRSAWEMAADSIGNFFEFLKFRQRRSVTLTVSVLNERMQLEACVESLKERIKFSEAKHSELTEVQKTLEQNKEKIEEDEKFTFTVTTAYKEKVDITDSSWRNRMVTSCNECQENCHEYNCWVAINAKWCKVMKDNNCTVCGCPNSKHIREGKKYVITRREEKVTIAKLEKKYGTTCGEKASYDENLLQCLETEHGKNLEMNRMMINLETKLKTLLTENEEKKKGLVDEAFMSIIKLSEIALKPDSAFTIQYLDFLIPRVEEAGTAEWAQKLKDLQRAADKGSTNSAVRHLSAIKKDIQNAAAKSSCISVLWHFSSEKKDMKGSSKKSTDSAEAYDNEMNREMLNPEPKESTRSAVGYGSRICNEMLNPEPRESTPSAVGYGSRICNDLLNPQPKESTRSAVGYGSRICNEMLNPEPKESTRSAVGYGMGYGSRICNEMLNPEPRESTRSAVGYGSRICNEMLNPEPKESTPSAVGYGSRICNEMLNPQPKESTPSAVGYGSRICNEMLNPQPKESTRSAVGYGSRICNEMLNPEPRESTRSAVGYGSRICNEMLNPQPRESTRSAVGYGSRICNEMLNPQPKESTPSAVGYGSRICNEMLNPEPRESTRSAVGYGRIYRLAAVCLGLLCVLLLTSIIVLWVQLSNMTIERDQLQTSYTNLTKERDQILTSNTNLAKERDQLLTSYTSLTKERDQILTSNTNLAKERDHLQISNTNLSKERDQLQTSNTNLAKERDLQLQNQRECQQKVSNLGE
ncbi:hypothetical protein NFI96_009470 [Prochilodus magdalenae]|nr:hypothetical protein NFI96_009470 [Prochilodus magdalenae]